MARNKTKAGTALALAVVMAVTLWGAPVNASDDSVIAGQELPTLTSVNQAAGEEDGKDAKISKEQAEKLLRQYVSIPEGFVLQNSRYGTNRLAEGTRTQWNLTFVKRANGKQLGAIHAALDAGSGQLLSYQFDDYASGAQSSYPLKVDREDAIKLAEAFIDQIAKPYAGDIKFNENYGVRALPPLSGAVIHSLRFERIVNGLPYTGNYIELSISSEGFVNAFNLQWDETIDFPKPGNYLNKEDALSALKSESSPVLGYLLPYSKPKGEIAPQLNYRLGMFAIDAVTGKKLEDAGWYHYRQGTLSETPLTREPLSSKPDVGPLTEKDAIAAVVASFPLPEGSVLESSGYNEYSQDEFGQTRAEWSFNWSVKKEGRDIRSIYVNVNGKNGAVERYYSYSNVSGADSEGNAITLDEAVVTATDAVKKQLPWLTHQLYIVMPDAKLYEDKKVEEIYAYNIRFARKVHGALTEYDNLNISVDPRTGEIMSYDGAVQELKYPDKNPSLISKAEAVNKWFDYYDIELTYRIDEQYKLDGEVLPQEKINLMRASGDPAFEQLDRELDIKLVYQLVDKARPEALYLDAQTGDWRSRETGVATTLELPRASDAEGHWAQDALQLMVAYRALDLNDGKVVPNQFITRGELIKMLVLARNNGRSMGLMGLGMDDAVKATASFADVAADSDYFAYVESALQENLIDLGDGSFNPDAPVTRDDMAELIVRALGYNSLANHEHIFKVPFKDSDAIDNKGQAAITVGLKIMSLSDGKFLPDKKVTRAEAATAFFRYLQKREELREAPLRM